MTKCRAAHAGDRDGRRGKRGAYVVPAWLALAAGLCHAGTAASSWSGAVALGSQLVDRGMAVGPATPTLQGAVYWTPSGEWSLGASAGAELRSPGRIVQTSLDAARYWPVTQNWRMQASLVYYRYPASAGAWRGARTEAGIGWTYRDILTLGVSAFRVNGGENHRLHGAADLDLRWPLAGHLAFSAGLGIAKSQAALYGEEDYAHAGRYYYGHAGLLWSRRRWTVELQRIASGGRAPRPWDVPDVEPWVATLSLAF